MKRNRWVCDECEMIGSYAEAQFHHTLRRFCDVRELTDDEERQLVELERQEAARRVAALMSYAKMRRL